MIRPESATLEGHGVRLEPLALAHIGELDDAARDGEQWRLFFTFVPKPDDVRAYIEHALAGQKAGNMLP